MDVFDGTSERDVGTRYDQSADQGADSGPTLVIEQKPDAVADSECSEDEYGDSQLTPAVGDPSLEVGRTRDGQTQSRFGSGHLFAAI